MFAIRLGNIYILDMLYRDVLKTSLTEMARDSKTRFEHTWSIAQAKAAEHCSVSAWLKLTQLKMLRVTVPIRDKLKGIVS